MDTEERVFYHAANVALHSDYRKLVRAKQSQGSWREAWRAFPSRERKALDPEKLWRILEQADIRLLLAEDRGYPPLLKEGVWPPLGIYCMGELPDSRSPTLAIVGTRKATPQGKETAKAFAEALAHVGVVIVSGLALGIDAAAHEGSLAGGSATIAVLGNGLPRIYPRLHERLARRILEKHGTLVSEYPPGLPSFPSHFLERNRIISGLASGTLIIEAPRESGALVTARFALEANRQVFVVPGPAGHPNFRGSHALIRSGAELVSDPTEVLEALGLQSSACAQSFAPRTEEEKIVLRILGEAGTPLPIDKIIELTNLKTSVVSQTISFLLVKNAVREEADGYAVA